MIHVSEGIMVHIQRLKSNLHDYMLSYKGGIIFNKLTCWHNNHMTQTQPAHESTQNTVNKKN